MSATDRLDARTGLLGVGAGVGAYLLGYLVTYLTHREWIDDRLRGWNTFAEFVGGDPIPSGRAVGWLYLNAHFVDLEVPRIVGGTELVNFVADAEGGAVLLLYLVPPLALLLAGVAVATVARSRSPGEGAVVAAPVVPGYLGAVVVGLVVFRYSVGDATVALDPIPAVLLAGLVYPLAFAGVGGALAGFVSESG